MTKLDHRPLGQTEITLPSLCVGTMMYGSQTPEDIAHRQMDRCFEFGINFLDTAELYSIPPDPETHGNSERIVGNWIKSRGVRDKVFLASKIAGRSGMTWMRDGQETRLTPAQIRKAVEGSLARLQTDYIDLYQLHWPDRATPSFGSILYGYRHYKDDYVPLEDTLGALDELKREGKIRHIGLSNETSWGVMKYLQIAKDKNWPRMVSIQNAYNLLNRYFESDLAEIAMQEKIGLLAYSPLGQGYLSGKYLDGKEPAGSRLALYGRLERYQTPAAEAAIRAYVSLAQDLKVDPAALALQFVTSRPWVTSNIFGATSDAQLDVVFQSLSIKWTREIDRAVNAIHAQYPNPCP